METYREEERDDQSERAQPAPRDTVTVAEDEAWRPGVTIRVGDYGHTTALIASESGDGPGLRAVKVTATFALTDVTILAGEGDLA